MQYTHYKQALQLAEKLKKKHKPGEAMMICTTALYLLFIQSGGKKGDVRDFGDFVDMFPKLFNKIAISYGVEVKSKCQQK